jgi:hypothetical protein
MKLSKSEDARTGEYIRRERAMTDRGEKILFMAGPLYKYFIPQIPNLNGVVILVTKN